MNHRLLPLVTLAAGLDGLWRGYRDRDHMASLIGRSANGLAEPQRLEGHSIFSWHSHEAVHVYSALVGRPSDFFNEGLAVALALDPLAGRFDGTCSGQPNRPGPLAGRGRERLACLSRV